MTDVDFKLGLLIEPEELVPYLGHELIRVVDLSRASVYEQLHIPHAIHLQPKFLVAQHEQANGVLPDLAGLQALVEKLNISSQHHIVVYDDEGGAWAGRLIWNLHCLGFNRTSLINGGIHAWLGAGLPTTADIDKVIPVSELVQVNLNSVQQYRVEYNELLQQVQQQNIQLWDCRTNEEYTGLRLAARRGGHIPNALHFEWSTALNRENHLKLHPLERTQQRLEQLGFNLQQPVVVYCQSHHRSGLAYILARLLNWQVRAYDGAWSEWGNRLDSPIISGGVTVLSFSADLKKQLFIKAQNLVPQHQLSRVIGKVAASENVLVKTAVIQAFKAKYGIDMSIAEQTNPNQYKSFNEFFTRALKQGVRGVDEQADSIVCPADGAISQLGKIEAGDIFQAKGQSFSVEKLIGDPQLAKPFIDGQFATVYLSPKDYHRVHMPLAGTLTETLYIPGELFSVNQTTAENVPGLFARNERMVCLFDTELGRMAVVLVGAMIVAGIETVATGKVKPTGRVELQHHQLQLDKGAELGRFYLGSTAVVLFEKDKMMWEEQFKANSTVVMGERLGHSI